MRRMHEVERAWLETVGRVLRPARPRLARCLEARDGHLAAQRAAEETKATARRRCEARIEEARARVFEAEDGVVGASMTELEREWRRLTRRDPDRGLMDLWAGMAPRSWLDRKRWRDAPPARQLDVAVALASAADDVEAAEEAALALRAGLARLGQEVGARIAWRPFEDAEHATMTGLLVTARRYAAGQLDTRAAARLDAAADVHERVLAAAGAHLAEDALLAVDLAHTAYVEALWTAAELAREVSPAAALRRLLATGHVLVAADARAITLGVPLPV